MDSAALKLRSAAQRFGWWCGRGEVHIPPCLCCGVEPIQHQYYTEGYNSGENFGCCWSRYICCVSAWMSAWLGQGFCKLFAKWVPCRARGVKHIWYPANKMLPPADSYICVWEHWPVLNDGIRCEPLERRRDSWLDGISSALWKAVITNHISMPGLVDVVGEFCWGMAISCIIPERDWPQRWWI